MVWTWCQKSSAAAPLSWGDPADTHTKQHRRLLWWNHEHIWLSLLVFVLPPSLPAIFHVFCFNKIIAEQLSKGYGIRGTALGLSMRHFAINLWKMKDNAMIQKQQNNEGNLSKPGQASFPIIERECPFKALTRASYLKVDPASYSTTAYAYWAAQFMHYTTD